ncbi:MAG: c-type cytochrome [Sulfurospirillaceae bacterium]|nr:c-type cytochrome [Sulfurospirillaceae bacterium]
MKKLLMIASIATATLLMAADGGALYKSCVPCHGAKAEKPALNKSQVIANWSEQQIADALNGYKAKTYGGALKGVMDAPMKTLDAEKIAVLSKYITTLK